MHFLSSWILLYWGVCSPNSVSCRHSVGCHRCLGLLPGYVCRMSAGVQCTSTGIVNLFPMLYRVPMLGPDIECSGVRNRYLFNRRVYQLSPVCGRVCLCSS